MHRAVVDKTFCSEEFVSVSRTVGCVYLSLRCCHSMLMALGHQMFCHIPFRAGVACLTPRREEVGPLQCLAVAVLLVMPNEVGSVHVRQLNLNFLWLIARVRSIFGNRKHCG